MKRYKLRMMGLSERNECLFEQYFHNSQPYIELTNTESDIALIDLDALEASLDLHATVTIYVSIDDCPINIQKSPNMYFIRKPLTIDALDACFDEVLKRLPEMRSEQFIAASNHLTGNIQKDIGSIKAQPNNQKIAETAQVIDGLCAQLGMLK